MLIPLSCIKQTDCGSKPPLYGIFGEIFVGLAVYSRCHLCVLLDSPLKSFDPRGQRKIQAHGIRGNY